MPEVLVGAKLTVAEPLANFTNKWKTVVLHTLEPTRVVTGSQKRNGGSLLLEIPDALVANY